MAVLGVFKWWKVVFLGKNSVICVPNMPSFMVGHTMLDGKPMEIKGGLKYKWKPFEA
jgi:hypothetical protein